MCEYCEDRKKLRQPPNLVQIDEGCLTIEVDKDDYWYQPICFDIELNYCPMCGEKIGCDAS